MQQQGKHQVHGHGIKHVAQALVVGRSADGEETGDEAEANGQEQGQGCSEHLGPSIFLKRTTTLDTMSVARLSELKTTQPSVSMPFAAEKTIRCVEVNTTSAAPPGNPGVICSYCSLGISTGARNNPSPSTPSPWYSIQRKSELNL